MNRMVHPWARSVASSVLGAAVAVALLGCGGNAPAPVAARPPAEVTPATPAEPGVSPVVSAEILAREPIANTATVKHILISWQDLGEAFQGRLDPRAAKRSKAEAEALVRALTKQLQDGADFDTVMKANSEDLGSATTGRPFTVTPDAQLVIEFRQLSTRLRVGELGVIQSDFGFHIIKRLS
jgi:hypothetical protein